MGCSVWRRNPHHHLRPHLRRARKRPLHPRRRHPHPSPARPLPKRTSGNKSMPPSRQKILSWPPNSRNHYQVPRKHPHLRPRRRHPLHPGKPHPPSQRHPQRRRNDPKRAQRNRTHPRKEGESKSNSDSNRHACVRITTPQNLRISAGQSHKRPLKRLMNPSPQNPR